VRDLSLHVLDLIENSIRANASVVQVTVHVDSARGRLALVIEDNGPGLEIPADAATDPFYTTKDGKRTGLGLSLLRDAAERADGSLALGKSPLGGLRVEADMQLDHFDRSPMGDFAATLSSVVCTNPDLDLRCKFLHDGREYEVRAADVGREVPSSELLGLAVARRVSEKISAGLAALPVL